jgi:N6-adenosine-specific RNA methylase IME4
MIDFPDKKYNIIYADPPWTFGSKAYQDGGRDFNPLNKQYQTMTTIDIKKLHIPTADDCACFMWSTDAHLKEAIEVMESWGFSYKTIAFVWQKKYESGSLVYNFAPWTLKSYEICLFGTKGQMGKYKKKNNIKQHVGAVRTKHSKKPNEVRDRIVELFGDISRIELFAREKKSGWDSWGNEINDKNN